MGDGFAAEGEVSLNGATIGKTLDCGGGTFTNKDKIALNADGLKVVGYVFLRTSAPANADPIAFKAQGEVNFVGADIGQNLDCSGGKFSNANGYAINAAGLKTQGNVFLTTEPASKEKFKADGSVNLLSASIEKDLFCDGGQFLQRNPRNTALLCDRGTLKGNVWMGNGFTANGPVSFSSASIGQSLECSGGTFSNPATPENPDNMALRADGMIVRGNVNFTKFGDAPAFASMGEVNLYSASVGLDLNCSGGQLSNKGGLALRADGLKVRGKVLLSDDFRAEGEVSLTAATIGIDLVCSRGQFLNGGKIALNADSLKVEAGVYCDDKFNAVGEVHFGRARVGGYFLWNKVSSTEKIKLLDLNFARIGTLGFATDSWPNRGCLLLDGLVYEQIDLEVEKGTLIDVENLKGWLLLQQDDKDSTPQDAKAPDDAKDKKPDAAKKRPSRPRPQYYSQPYTQLASVLRRDGHEDDADLILIAKSHDDPLLGEAWYKKLWHRFIGFFLDYGYRPSRAFWAALCFIVCGAIFYGLAFHFQLDEARGQSRPGKYPAGRDCRARLSKMGASRPYTGSRQAVLGRGRGRNPSREGAVVVSLGPVSVSALPFPPSHCFRPRLFVGDLYSRS